MEKIIEENKQGEPCFRKQTRIQKTIYRKLWLCDELSDSEIVASILSVNGYNTTQVLKADLVLVKHLFHKGQSRTNRS
jgi:tRNA-2-methylthio-N6-dimethylallyladenosine synthase